MNFDAVKALAVKEFRDLVRDPRIWVPFVLSAIILPLIGVIMVIAMGATIRQTLAPQSVALVDLDQSAISRRVAEWLAKRGFEVATMQAGELNELTREAAERGASLLVVIEESFERSLLLNGRPKVKIVGIIEEISLLSQTHTARVTSALSEFVVKTRLEERGLSYDLVQNPLNVSESLYIVAKDVLLANPQLLLGISMAAFVVPLILLSVALVVMQMAATSMAIENEERTLETLLTLPMSNYEILLSKLLGMFAVSLLGTAFEVAGFSIYFYFILLVPTLLAGAGQAPHVDLLLSPGDLAYIAVSLLLSLFFAAAVGLVVGALSRDVRIANTMMGPLSMLFYLPTFFVIFTPSEALGPLVLATLYSLPITQPVIAARDAVGARLPAVAPLYLLASLAISLLAVYVTSKLLSLEILSSLQYRLSALFARGGRVHG